MLAGEGPALLPYDAAGIPEPAHGPDTPLDPGEDDPDDPTGLVVGTSGSTGSAKGALLPVSALAASAAATRARIVDDPRPVHWLLVLPAHHVAGIQVLLRAIAEGTEPVIPDLTGGFTARGLQAAIAAMPAGPRVTSLVPTQLHRVLQDPEATAALAGLDAVLVGGAATAPALQERARAAGIRLRTTYGMTETCGGCVYDGVPLDGVAIDLAGGGTGSGGLIGISGPVLARGYRGRPADPAFEPGPPRTFRTADLGAWAGDGTLHVQGRADDVIITGGIKIAPALVEAALAGLPGVAEVVVVGVPDAEWGQAVAAVVVPVPGSAGPDPAAVRAAARSVHPAAAPRRVIVVDALPLRGPGKPDRMAIRALAARPEDV
ncbi:AMP-binding protein [Nakamurella sp. YIM 132087]|uniref:AMP-binding protein n=2 Tax=Nakamurella alba TaxID=2665158 RepID=A0A7K1FK17_9ACTN|nr:AMP-binding protein [Nakamurella alba]